MSDKEENKICDDCGAQDFSYIGPCPYAEEINNSVIECVLCADCYHERCMDI